MLTKPTSFLYLHKTICRVLLILQNSIISFYPYYNTPRQSKQVTYVLYKSRRGPKFSDLLKKSHNCKTRKKDTDSRLPASGLSFASSLSPFIYITVSLPGPHSYVHGYLNLYQSILDEFIFPFHRKSLKTQKEKSCLHT